MVRNFKLDYWEILNAQLKVFLVVDTKKHNTYARIGSEEIFWNRAVLIFFL